MFSFRCFLLILLTHGIAPSALSQVVINEVCSFNGSVLSDDDGRYPDWIELYNESSTPVSLLNYSIRAGNDDRWFFPSVILQPQQFLVIYASGKNQYTLPFHTSFKISKKGEILILYNNNGVVVDEMDLPSLHLDHSYGRKPDGNSGTHGIFSLPTPGLTNQSSGQYSGYTAPPEFSSPAGFYQGALSLDLAHEPSTQIHYTLNGAVPGPTTLIYTGPLTISSTQVVRARAYSTQTDLLPSEIITNTYFIGEDIYLPVVSISTNPSNLWDWNTGIYVSGPNASPFYPYYGANFWQDWVIESNMEFFETDGTRKISQRAGVSIHGGSSNRSKPMKSLRLESGSEYGDDEFSHRFFHSKNIDGFHDLVLRNSSGDFNKTHFRDGSLHDLMIGNLNIDLTAYRPAVVFLNGEYHGIHNIREKINKFYVAENHAVDKDNIDLLEEETIVIEGDFSNFTAAHNFITGNNIAQQQNFNAAAEMMDVGSLADYYIAETFLSNIDWPYNNVKFWRSREPGALWRYILIDLDISLGNNGWAPASFDVLGRIMGTYGDTSMHVQIFRSLLMNPGYREYFINRYADVVNTLFSTENLRSHILKIRSALEPSMPEHFAKWGNDMQGWDNEIYNVVMPYVNDRPGYALEQVRNVFVLNEVVNLTLDVWPPGAGSIRVNTIKPGPLPWDGKYFDGNPVTVEVTASPGYDFVSWISDGLELTSTTMNKIRFNPEPDGKLTAYFGHASDKDELIIYPNPARESVTVGFMMEKESSGVLEIIAPTGQVVGSGHEVHLTRGLNTMDCSCKHLCSGVYRLRLITDEGIKYAQLVKY